MLNQKFDAAMFVAFDSSKAGECIEKEKEQQKLLLESVGKDHPAGMTAQTVLDNLQKLQSEEERDFYFLKHALRSSAGEYRIFSAYGIVPERQKTQIIGAGLKYGYRLEFVRAFEPGCELKSVKFTFKHLRDVFKMYEAVIEAPDVRQALLTEEKDRRAFAELPYMEVMLNPQKTVKEHALRIFAETSEYLGSNKMPVFGYVYERRTENGSPRKEIVFRAMCHSFMPRDFEKWQERAVLLLQKLDIDLSAETRWRIGKGRVLRYLNSEFQPKPQKSVVQGSREPAKAKVVHCESNVCAICGRPLHHSMESMGEELCRECSGKQEQIVDERVHIGEEHQHGTFC